MDKDNDSMATVQMKPEYAASEVYSTVSEPPPAYKTRNSNSVQIAKIIAGTIIISSFIIGLFIFGSTYVQAKASCNYMDSLQAVMERELLLEKYDDYPRAEAFHDGDNSGANNHISSSDKLNAKRHDKNNIDTKSEVESSDSSYSDSDESDELNRVQIKLPLDLDLGDIANAILETNQKARMNCVVERRRAEEVLDAPAKTMQLPFGLNITTDPKKQKITGERMVIICESGSSSEERNNDEAEQMRPIVIPINAIPLQFGPQGQQFPITHLPNQMPPQELIHQLQEQAQLRQIQQQVNMQQMEQEVEMHKQMQYQQQQAHIRQQMIQQQQQQEQQQSHIRQFLPQQFFQQLAEEQQQTHQLPPQPQPNQMPPQSHMHQLPIHQLPPQPPVPAQMMQAPRPESEVRIQLQRVQVPAPVREVSKQGRNGEMPQFQVQQVPLAVALQRAGITAEDLRNIQKMAEERIHDELRQFVSDESSDSESSNEASEEDSSATSQQQQMHPQILQMGRSTFGRSLVTPVRIPVPMMQQDAPQENLESERPHYLHPRSVRSANANVLLHREKRVKRCACDCNC